MKTRVILFALVAIAVAACGQTAEEKVKAYEAAHESMMTEYTTMMDSLSTDPAKAEEFYNDFIERYMAFNLDAAKSNPDNEVAVQVLMNLRGLIDDAQVDEIISKMPEAMLENEQVAYLKKGLDARKATAEGAKFVDFTVEHVYGYDRSVDPQPLKKEVKFSDYVGKGKYVLADFWASWCGPCRREIPNVKKVYDEFGGEKFDVVSIAVWDKAENTLKAIEEEKLEWPQIIDCQDVPGKLYGIEGIPVMILFGPDGTIVERGGELRGANMEPTIAKYVK